MWCQRMMDIPTEFNKKDIFSTNQIKLSSIFLKKTGKTIKRTNDNLSKNTDIKLQIERNQSYKTIIYISLCLLQWKPRFLEKETDITFHVRKKNTTNHQTTPPFYP